jgi:4a-hydroxytetrahydrobiopterin dehydratase
MSTEWSPTAGASFCTNHRSPDDIAHHGIVFSSGQPDELPDRALKLLPVWDLSATKKGITRQYIFPSFSKAWTFMSSVAEECKIKKHHPSWSNLYNVVTIEWTTHKPEGLSIKDVEMAEFCDRRAEEIGLKS